MQFYLSSYELGENPERLASLFGANKRIAYIPNARDFVGADPARKNERTRNDMAGLASLGLEPELLDLREYFGNTEGLIAKLDTLAGVWVSGGNTFVLRQTMRLSGFDTIFPRLLARSDFVYG
ncbi:MAG TPA: Type 1 glutamine amidotransferase-like domain-containing protein [bacterium]|nr:Type 1 glutamine amidotransferase-like domain-containing protein [bacterium]